MSGEPSAEVQNDESSSDRDNWQPNHAVSAPSATRKDRLPRACTSRHAYRLHGGASSEKRTTSCTEKDDHQPQQHSTRVITPLIQEPPPSQLARWGLRSMWELASLLNFLHIFRPLLNITAEFSAEELETALLTPNGTLDDIHIPLLKAIPPITRMALGRATWVTVLCRKLKDWWHWVADGEIPIVASHGMEVETYKNLDPATRVVILKALCDIRVEQEDIRSYIDDSLKHGIKISTFRKERIGGDSHTISYWYEDDPVIGHRMYREIKKVELKKGKGRMSSQPPVFCQWETVATNLEEFQGIFEKLMSSKNRIETSFGKKLLIDIIPEVEKEHKRRERLTKKQHRQALLLDNFLNAEGLATGRSLRDRKPVTYTFDDYDRCISEAIKITKKRQLSPETIFRRESVSGPEASANGSKWNDIDQSIQHASSNTPSPKSTDHEEIENAPLERNNRRRQRPQRYSAKEFVEAVSGNEADFDSDDEIVGEAVYDDNYLRSRKQRKVSSSSEGDEEYIWEHDNAEDEEEDDNSLSMSDDELRQRARKVPSRSRRGVKTRSVDELQLGLRRSSRSTRTNIDYRQYEISDSELDSAKTNEHSASEGNSDASNDAMGHSEGSQDSNIGNEAANASLGEQEHSALRPEDANDPPDPPAIEPDEGKVQKRQFLDLNELAPGATFDDGSASVSKHEDIE